MKNIISKSLFALAIGGILMTGSAFAQSTPSGAGPGVVDPGHPRVNEVNRREENQQDRIANGVKNGTMSAGQTARVEHREANLQRTEQKDMAQHNGHLTKSEQRNLNHRQNNISRTIHNDKHPR